jgi:hypothetical protein
LENFNNLRIDSGCQVVESSFWLQNFVRIVFLPGYECFVVVQPFGKRSWCWGSYSQRRWSGCSNPEHSYTKEIEDSFMSEKLPLACQVRQFFEGKEPFPTILPFEKQPSPQIDRLIEHLRQARNNKELWVKVPTEDLYFLLCEHIRSYFRSIGIGE